MALEAEIAAIRTSVALSTARHVGAVRVSGDGAFDALDGVCPRELHLQDGQALHTLFLDDDARPLADVYVCADGDDFLVIGETRAQGLAEYLRARIGPTPNVAIDDLT